MANAVNTSKNIIQSIYGNPLGIYNQNTNGFSIKTPVVNIGNQYYIDVCNPANIIQCSQVILTICRDEDASELVGDYLKIQLRGYDDTANFGCQVISLDTICNNTKVVKLEFDVMWAVDESQLKSDADSQNRWNIRLENIPYDTTFWDNASNNIIFNMGLLNSSGAFGINDVALSSLWNNNNIHYMGGTTHSNLFWNKWIHFTLEVNFEKQKLYAFPTYCDLQSKIINGYGTVQKPDYFIVPFKNPINNLNVLKFYSVSTKNNDEQWLGIANLVVTVNK